MDKAKTRLWVDFNDFCDGDRIVADTEFAHVLWEPDLREGVSVELFDGAGHSCNGAILSIAQLSDGSREIELQIDWGTWTSERRWHVEVPVATPQRISFSPLLKTA